MGKNLYTTAYELLLSGKKIIFVRTIRRSGSTPRGVGSMCIVTEEGTLFGTVGGGLLEHKVQQQAMALIKQGNSFIYRFRLTNDDLAAAGMICGGQVDLYLEPLFPENTGTVSLLKTINRHIAENRPGILVTRIKDGTHAMDTGTNLFMDETCNVYGTIPGVDPETLTLNRGMLYHLMSLDDKGPDLFLEKIEPHPMVYLFGAGHVSIYVAQLAKLVGFGITVVDDRPEFANAQRFPDADSIIVSDFKHAFQQLDISQNAYILIITRGHVHDKSVLEQSLSTFAAYIGMIGSIKKRDIIYKELMDKGVSKERLESVYSPVGLDINAETPEEIAVSIVGELIKKRGPEKKLKNRIV